MQSVATLQSLLAFCIAQTVDAVLLKGERSASPRMEQAAVPPSPLQDDSM
jgi:hypothetical protein